MRTLSGRLSPSISLSLVLFATLARAQAPGTGAMTGAVRDPDGLAIKNAQVSLSNDATHAARSTATSDTGTFTVSLLAPGSYTVQVSAPGFETETLHAAIVTVSETTALDVRLPAAARTQTVVVDADSQAELVQTESAALGRALGSAAIADLPLSTRNYTQILSLSPGVLVGLPDATQIRS